MRQLGPISETSLPSAEMEELEENRKEEERENDEKAREEEEERKNAEEREKDVQKEEANIKEKEKENGKCSSLLVAGTELYHYLGTFRKKSNCKITALPTLDRLFTTYHQRQCFNYYYSPNKQMT